MRYTRSAAQDAQFELSQEIDTETAKIIREEGIPLFDAIQIAKNRIRRRRKAKQSTITIEKMRRCV